MRRLVSVLLVGLMLLPSPALAADPAGSVIPARASHLAALSGGSGPLALSAGREAKRLATLPATVRSRQPEPRRERGWIARHPMLFGAAVGFGAGFAIGYAAGDDGVWDDFTGASNGLFLGGILCGVGAGVGYLAGRLGGN